MESKERITFKFILKNYINGNIQVLWNILSSRQNRRRKLGAKCGTN